jgi:hypothetical protein
MCLDAQGLLKSPTKQEGRGRVRKNGPIWLRPKMGYLVIGREGIGIITYLERVRESLSAHFGYQRYHLSVDTGICMWYGYAVTLAYITTLGVFLK